METGRMTLLDHGPHAGHGLAPSVQSAGPYTVVVTGRTWREIERDVYLWAIRSTRSLRQAAALLAIPRATFNDRVRRIFNVR